MNEDRYFLSKPRMMRIGLVGCGGTGSLLAEKLMRLLTGTKIDLVLIDHDHVEEHNLLRQGFYQRDLGQNKALALANRLARDFRRKITAVPRRADQETLHNMQIIIGCVDNAAARRVIESVYDASNQGQPRAAGWYIDAGNDENTGQVLIGNVKGAPASAAKRWFDKNQERNHCHRLPSPGTQQPALLVNRPEGESADIDCAQAIMLRDQDPAINDAMATLVNNTVYRILTERCTHMAQYLDLDNGTLTTVQATPANVQKVLS